MAEFKEVEIKLTKKAPGRAEKYDYNLLISYDFMMRFGLARKELINFLNSLGDETPIVNKTLARGILGLKTSLDNRKVVQEARKKYKESPEMFRAVIKFVPIDNWVDSTLESMKKEVDRFKITKEDKWRMTVEKRRYEKYHTAEIIEALAKDVQGKVDLENPNKIIRIEILGPQAGISLLKPDEIFSTREIIS